MKKILVILLAALFLFGCSAKTEPKNDPKHLEELKIQFVPSRPAEEIVKTTSGLDKLLIAELAKSGYTVDKVTIDVSTSFEAAGEALSAGSIDLAWLPSGTYLTYADEVDVILTATRAGLSNDSTNPADWNGLANKTLRNGPQVSYYKGLIYAGPSEKGKALAAKVNAGQKLTWEDISKVTWGVSSSPTSNAGYSFPTLWLMKNFDGHKIPDIQDAGGTVVKNNYANCFQQLAAEQVDVIVCYADGRTDYEQDWVTPTDKETSKGKGWGRSATIWEEVNVIGVTDNIYNDTVSITKAKPQIYNPDFISAFQNAMINISKTPEGKAIIAIYTHEGYNKSTAAEYTPMIEALKAVK